jgi:hypothetical protein
MFNIMIDVDIDIAEVDGISSFAIIFSDSTNCITGIIENIKTIEQKYKFVLNSFYKNIDDKQYIVHIYGFEILDINNLYNKKYENTQIKYIRINTRKCTKILMNRYNKAHNLAINTSIDNKSIIVQLKNRKKKKKLKKITIKI